MSKKRERVMIIHDILKAIQDKQGKARPTHILYKSNLSSQMLKEYLTDLIEKKLISEVHTKKGDKTYELTDKGHQYLEDFVVIKNFMDSYGLD